VSAGQQTGNATPTIAPVTYPHIGTVLVAAGTGANAFAAAVGGAIPDSVKGVIAGLGVAFVSAGLFLLGRASV
jgi:hypothetical protein